MLSVTLMEIVEYTAGNERRLWEIAGARGLSCLTALAHGA